MQKCKGGFVVGISSLFVCALGIGTVFFGLICIVLLCYLMSAACNMFEKKNPETAKQAQVTLASGAPAVSKVENKQEIIAAFACAIAQELGTDVEGIRIKSFKKL